MADAKVFGVIINDASDSEILSQIKKRVTEQTAGYLATVNPELLLLSQADPGYKAALDQADLRVCDGVGVQWAAAFNRRSYPKIINILRWPFSLVWLLLQPSSAKRVVHHRTTGRELFEELLAYCAATGYRVYFLGGAPGVAEQVTAKASHLYPLLKIAGSGGGNPEQADDVINHLHPSDLLFVAYGSPKQELFIHQHLPELKTHLAIGVGGSFDYFVGAKPIGSLFKQIKPPKLIRQLGLESFWRLATQPSRIGRIWKSVAVFSFRVASSDRRK